MDKEYLHPRMEISILVNGKMERGMEMESASNRIMKNMKANGRMICIMDMVKSKWPMGLYIKEIGI